MSVYRLGRAVREWTHVLLTVASALAIGLTPLGIVPTLLLAGAAGVALYGSRTWGLVAALVILVLYGAIQWGSAWWTLLAALTGTSIGHPGNARSPSLWEMGLFFLKVGAFTFGGGLTILAFIQEQVVNQLHWLTPQQFLDGLALGQLTSGPTLILAAFVGYTVGTFWSGGGSSGRLPALLYIDARGAAHAGAHQAPGLDAGRVAGHQPRGNWHDWWWRCSGCCPRRSRTSSLG